MKIEREYVNYGKGHPGWNKTVRIMDDHGNLLAHASWPMVNGPTISGRDPWSLSLAKEVFGLPDDHPRTKEILSWFD
jgi:hypothetical protein